MKQLRLLTLSILLVTFSATTISAQEGGGCNPGNTQSPPCAAAQSLPPDQESTDQTASTVTTQTASTTEVLTEVILGLTQALLAIF